MKISVISNIHSLGEIKKDGLELDVGNYPIDNRKISVVFHAFVKSFKFDYIIFNCANFDVFLFAFFKLLIPFNRCKLIAVDIILKVPENVFGKIIQAIRIISLKKVHLFLLYFKNTIGYQKIHHISSERLRYIPFKINAYELIMRTKVSDEGYIFVGGRTRRDFPTLIKAVRDLSYPVKIVAPFRDELSRHGSYLDESNLQKNVEVIHDDGTAESFIRFIAASRLVVLPIKKETISPSGISVYIMAMALRKCVIISSGPAVDGIISCEEAIIVPPGDPESLRWALARAYTDDSYRRRFEEKGFKYAIKLGGTQRLNENIINEIYWDFCGKLRSKSI